ncbi:MAG: hypothetical protein K9K87_14790 [Desulfotignum sp.]|nr:hypothetical protein [Desulfotignum sp.]
MNLWSWSQALVNADDFGRFKALQWGIRTWDVWNFMECDPRFGDDWPGRIPAQLVAAMQKKKILGVTSRHAEFVSKVLKQPFHRFPHGIPAGTCELLEDMQSADVVDNLVFARDRKRSAVT